MPTIALLSLKGGVGKTTIAMNLAAELGATKLFDMDPQGHALTWAGLAGPEQEGFRLARDVMPIRVPTALALTHELEPYQDELVIIDLPPALEGAANLVVLVVELVLIPAGPSPLDIAAAREAVTLCRDAFKRNRDAFKRKGSPTLKAGRPRVLLVPSKLQVGTVLSRETPDVLAELGEAVTPSLHNRVAHVEASLEGSVVSRTHPGSQAHKEIRALAARVKADI